MQGSIASVVKSIRARRGLTMVGLGKLLGVQHPTISQYEHGKIAPSRSVLLLLAPLAETDLEKATIAQMLAGGSERGQDADWLGALEGFERMRADLEQIAKRLAAGSMSPDNAERLEGLFQRSKKQTATAYLTAIEAANPRDPRIAPLREEIANMPDGIDLIAEYLRGAKPTGNVQ